MQNNRHGKGKNKVMAVLGILVALLLFSFKKKPEPSVEVGEGNFGAPDTDGTLDAVTAKSKVVPSSSKNPIDITGLRPSNRTMDDCCY